MKSYLRVMKALSDGGRVKAIKLLERGELCVCELQAALGLAQPTVSKHLKILEDAGLVSSRKAGPWVYYALSGGDSEYARAMLVHLGSWLGDDPEVAAALAAVKGCDRERMCPPRPGKTGSGGHRGPQPKGKSS